MTAAGPTAILAAKAGGLRLGDIPADSRELAKQCLLDWLGVAFAARDDELVAVLAETARDEGGHEQAGFIGRGARGTMAQAALVNGAMGHTLDYDDAHVTMGHPTAPVAPAAIAVGEHRDCSGAALLTAFVAGVETAVDLSRLTGPDHYRLGFHGTGTFGTFGSAAAVGHLLGLDRAGMTRALGIAGTQAAGLKAVFGTMSKPLNAAKAAANGLLAARLAARGFTSCDDILMAEQGFVATLGGQWDGTLPASAPARFHVRDVLFKFHASCYLTHSAIEAARSLASGLALDAIRTITIGIDPGHLRVCCIDEPRTGLACKFSITHMVAMALAGDDTSDAALYTDGLAHRADLVTLRRRATIAPRQTDSFTRSDVTVTLVDGRVLRAEADVAMPAADPERQWPPLIRKFRRLVEPALGIDAAEAVVAACRDLENLATVRTLTVLLR